MASRAAGRFRLALVQLAVTASKQTNLANARSRILDAATKGAQLVVLPECFNSPYGTEHFAQYAERVPEGESCEVLSKVAKEAGVYLVGGSIPEAAKDGSGKFFNTCTVWDPQGSLPCVRPCTLRVRRS